MDRGSWKTIHNRLHSFSSNSISCDQSPLQRCNKVSKSTMHIKDVDFLGWKVVCNSLGFKWANATVYDHQIVSLQTKNQLVLDNCKAMLSGNFPVKSALAVLRSPNPFDRQNGSTQSLLRYLSWSTCVCLCVEDALQVTVHTLCPFRFLLISIGEDNQR